ncbi:ArdC-like ssDNA-binding domain-containing protein [Anaerobaca lacustris]|uniref:ArdC-like ssDNA-binding domain-containing protein n=1 Tax=Anaerobaca lacustris TaxID=3044600 RepID=A0AAW6U0B3_9BACT|nr:ArdC-like ssDNA-binding domain-containing protein [Sedimentisphaerales bacterium M17dextr]
MKMDGAEIRKVSEEALEQLAAALEQGKSETLKRYLAVMAKFTHYSLGNQILIARQKPEATRVAGYRAWQRLGRRVRRGERGIRILAPIVRRCKDEEDEEETVVAFRGACVFDISQTDGEPLDSWAAVEGDPGEWITRLRAYTASLGIELKYEHRLGGAIGVSQGGTILLKADLALPEQFSALVHELAHEMLHQGDGDRPASKVVRELEAEAVAFVVSHAIGLDAMDSSRDYIHLYDGDKQTLLRSLERIRRTAVTIINGINPSATSEVRAA